MQGFFVQADNYQKITLLFGFPPLPKNASETLKAPLQGKKAPRSYPDQTKGISFGLFFRNTTKKEEQTGVIVIESRISPKITKHVGNIKDAYENYLALEAWKLPIKINYLLTLGFLTLVIALHGALGWTEDFKRDYRSRAEPCTGD